MSTLIQYWKGCNNLRLNIIGNGFDLYHGLPSKYQDFAIWLINNDHELFENIGKYYDVLIYNTRFNRYEPEYVEYIVDDKFWSTFEFGLGRINPMAFEEQLLDDLGLENEDPVSIIQEVNADQVAIKLKERFSEWVYNTVDKEKNYSIIKRFIGNYKCNLDINDEYIVFNYTHLLQKVYKIPDQNIYYPHGECIDSNSSLIVGHGNSKEIDNLRNDIAIMEDNYSYCQAERNRIDEKLCELLFLKKLEKNVKEIGLRLKYHIDMLPNTIDHIFVYGFSFGDVDMPYIKILSDKYSAATWHISYLNKDISLETTLKTKIKQYVENDKMNICFFEFCNPISDYIRKRILSD